MVIAPVAPALPPTAAPVTAATEPAVATEETLHGQVEVPFVPAGQRHSAQAASASEPVKDSIVVVGKAQRTNRKRMKADVGAKVSQTEEFDYSAVSNILDEESEPEQPEAIDASRKRKQKGQGGHRPISCAYQG